MDIDRRTFLFGATLVMACAASARRLMVRTSARPPQSPRVALRIAGWEAPGDDPTTELWIALGRSWRTAWR